MNTFEYNIPGAKAAKGCSNDIRLFVCEPSKTKADAAAVKHAGKVPVTFIAKHEPEMFAPAS